MDEDIADASSVSLLAKMTTETPVALYTYNGNTLPF
jgi:hypothetical protein